MKCPNCGSEVRFTFKPMIEIEQMGGHKFTTSLVTGTDLCGRCVKRVADHAGSHRNIRKIISSQPVPSYMR